MTPETYLANQIKLYCGEHNYIIIRQQSGNFYSPDGVPVKMGFKGLSDYLVITDTGKPIFVETKIHPRKPTADQINFINNMRSRGVSAGVCYSLEDFIRLCNNLL